MKRFREEKVCYLKIDKGNKVVILDKGVRIKTLITNGPYGELFEVNNVLKKCDNIVLPVLKRNIIFPTQMFRGNII